MPPRVAKAGFTLAEGVTHVAMPPKFAKAGFTLAEVLITLGIIGIVAAMTMPNLMSKIQKRKLETQIKANYSNIQQVIKFADYDDVSSDIKITNGNLDDMKKWFDSFLGKHLKVEQICMNEVGCWHKKGVVKDLNGNVPYVESDYAIGIDTITFRTAKGAYYIIDSYSSGSILFYFGVKILNKDGLVFWIDANGDRKPNRIGKDIYPMVWTEKGLVPAGNSLSREEVEKNCLKDSGYLCTQKLINDGWVIDERVWKR